MPGLDDGFVDSKQIQCTIAIVVSFHAFLIITGKLSFPKFCWGMFMQLLYWQTARIPSFPKFNIMCMAGIISTGDIHTHTIHTAVLHFKFLFESCFLDTIPDFVSSGFIFQHVPLDANTDC
jgi:hypothetical protein